MWNILITGAAGFIGNDLIKRLSRHHRVTAVDIINKSIDIENLKWVQADLSDDKKIKSIFEKIAPDIVIHCAGIAHQKVGTVNSETYKRINSDVTEYIAKVALEQKPDFHFIFLSSISVYGETNLISPVSEDSHFHPSSDYALSKLDAERRLIKLYDKRLLHKLTILRLTPVYDYEFRLNLERRVLGPKKIAYIKFGNGHQTLSALSRPNLVEFIEHLLKNRNGNRCLEIMNISDLDAYSFHHIIRVFKTSNLYPYRATVLVPLTAVWILTRIAGLIFKQQRQWFHSCYAKVAENLVFDNSRMLQTGFKPRHTLKSVFSIKNK